MGSRIKLATAGKLIIISAPSGVGKSSLVAKLCAADPRLVVSISYTTRPQYHGEQDGVHYFFVDMPTFQGMIEMGRFLEYATVYDHAYGTPKAWVKTQLNANRDVILEIDWYGAKQARASMPNSHYIFVLPPSIRELEARLKKRRREDDAAIKRRMREVKNELAHYDQADYIVVNDDFSNTLSELKRIISAIRGGQPAQQKDMSQLVSDLMAES